MKNNAKTTEAPFQNRELLLLVSLFVLELSMAITLIAMHMKGERHFAVFLSSRPGMALLGAIAIIAITGGMVIHEHLTTFRSRFRYFMLIAMMNLITVLLIVVTGEIMVRVGSHQHLMGEAFAKKMLSPPKNWEATKLHYRRQIEKTGSDRNLSYMVYDDVMGWTVGPERQSANGLYFSNAEGTRSPRQEAPFPHIEGRPEIALVGDSFTFGEEVRYEESWGYYLDQMLDKQFQILNYGVPGYSVGQAYRRYEKEVRRRNPKVVIFGIISHDLFRTMWPYPFLAVSGNMPFSKPRFVLREGELQSVNVPPLPPNAILSKRSPSELPFLEYQVGYRKNDWEENLLLQHSYLFRLFSSMFPDWRVDHPHLVTDELLSVNRAIIQTFVRSATEAGSIPLVVYFPSRGNNLQNPSTPSLGKRVLQEAGIDFIDPTPCLLEVNRSDRFLVNHYTPQANAAVAKCLYRALSEVLGRSSAATRNLNAPGYLGEQ